MDNGLIEWGVSTMSSRLNDTTQPPRWLLEIDIKAVKSELCGRKQRPDEFAEACTQTSQTAKYLPAKLLLRLAAATTDGMTKEDGKKVQNSFSEIFADIAKLPADGFKGRLMWLWHDWFIPVAERWGFYGPLHTSWGYKAESAKDEAGRMCHFFHAKVTHFKWTLVSGTTTQTKEELLWLEIDYRNLLPAIAGTQYECPMGEDYAPVQLLLAHTLADEPMKDELRDKLCGVIKQREAEKPDLIDWVLLFTATRYDDRSFAIAIRAMRDPVAIATACMLRAKAQYVGAQTIGERNAARRAFLNMMVPTPGIHHVAAAAARLYKKLRRKPSKKK